jgi:hypothetical protein
VLRMTICIPALSELMFCEIERLFWSYSYFRSHTMNGVTYALCDSVIDPRRLTCITPLQSGLAPKVHLISTAGIARYMHSFPVHVHYWPRVSASYISPCTRLRVAVVSTHFTRSSEGFLGRLGWFTARN